MCMNLQLWQCMLNYWLHSYGQLHVSVIKFVIRVIHCSHMTAIEQFRYIKIQSQTIDLSTRLWGIIPTNSVFIPLNLALRSVVLG